MMRELSAQMMSEPTDQAVTDLRSCRVEHLTVGTMRSYAPESEETMSWAEYQQAHPDFVVGQDWRQVAGAVNSAASRVGQNPKSIFPLRPK